MNPAPLVTRLRPYFLQGSPESHGSVPYGELGWDGQTSCLQIKEKFPPALRALPIAIQKAHEFLFPFRGSANNDQHALFVIFHASLEINAVSPHVDIVLAVQPPFVPLVQLVFPLLAKAKDCIACVRFNLFLRSFGGAFHDDYG